MAIKSVTRMVGQTTLVNTETNEETIQPITIIENIVQQSVTTNVQNIVNESVTNVIQNTTIIVDNPEISAALVKLETIQEGAQVNPDLTPITEAIGTKADAESVNTAFQSVNQSLSATEEVLTTHKENVANPHVTTKEQTGIRSQSGIIQFINESQKNILFTPNYFTKAPEVPLTLLDVDLTPPVRINVSKDGMTVKTKTRFTGKIGFIATEL